MNLKNTQIRVRTVFVPANGELAMTLAVSDSLRIFESVGRLLEIEIDGGNPVPIWAGWNFNQKSLPPAERELFTEIRLVNPTPRRARVVFSHGRGNIDDDSLNIAELVTPALTFSAPDKIATIPPVSIPALVEGAKGILVAPADRRVKWVDLNVSPDLGDVWVGDADVARNRGIMLRSGGDARRFDTSADIYAIADQAADQAIVTGIRAFHEQDQQTAAEIEALRELLALVEGDEGGDEGYDQTFPLGFVTTVEHRLRFEREFYVVKDRLRVTSNLGTLFDSGCTDEAGVHDVVLAPGTTWVRVEILADCEDVGGTEWIFACHVLD